MKVLTAETGQSLKHWGANVTCEVYDTPWGKMYLVNDKGLAYRAYPSWELLEAWETGDNYVEIHEILPEAYESEDCTLLLKELYNSFKFHMENIGKPYVMVTLGTDANRIYEVNQTLEDCMVQLWNEDLTVTVRTFDTKQELVAYKVGLEDAYGYDQYGFFDAKYLH